MGGAVSGPTVGEVVEAVNRRFPVERAEEWDQVGLLAGDPSASCTGVVVTLDPMRATVGLARDAGANLLLTHHPAYLTPPAPLCGGVGGGDVVHAALTAGVALANAHTNLDRDPAAQRLLPELLGFTPEAPLERSLAPGVLVTAYCPSAAADDVADAMAGEGAGRLGEYTGCSFSSSGVGRFSASSQASPSIGSPGEETLTGETRVEMVAPRACVRAVVRAAAGAHPYEEPLITVTAVQRARNAEALGMLATRSAPVTLGWLSAHAESVFGAKPRVWGDPSRSVEVAAFATGSAGSLVPDALSAGADVLVAGEVRYHDATEALERGLAVVELGHDVSEWPLVRLLADTVRRVPGIDASRVVELEPRAGWWTPEGERR